MRHASALAKSAAFVEHPLPCRAAAQLRLALDVLEPPRESRGPQAAVLPHLAWPDRPARARMSDGSPARRRPDLYDWLAKRRRRAQLAARHALE